MRLTNKEIDSIKIAFQKHFAPGDHLWLFGSRADDTKRGGDIDLYIETEEPELRTALKKKTAFITDLWTSIGEQRIDVVIHQLKRDHNELIYKVARETGIQLI
jgi:uncharacterized protein